MELQRFTPAHTAAVARWPMSAQEVVMWCGEREFPVSEQTIAGWQERDDVQAHLFTDGEKVLGYGELWFDTDEDEVELARIIVAPEARGNGLGRALVRELLARAVEAGFEDVYMRVHPDNAPALRCYQGAGFVLVESALAESWNIGQPVDYVWLQRDSNASAA